MPADFPPAFFAGGVAGVLSLLELDAGGASPLAAAGFDSTARQITYSSHPSVGQVPRQVTRRGPPEVVRVTCPFAHVPSTGHVPGLRGMTLTLNLRSRVSVVTT